METTLHRQLKELYCSEAAGREVWISDDYRADAVVNGELIEIQQASLSALKQKIRDLLADHCVRVVKPLASRKMILKRSRRNGPIVSQRASPYREKMAHLFTELVYFVGVFPHPRLTLEILLTEQEEIRIPRKPRRWRGKDYRVEDRRLVNVVERRELRTAEDLLVFLPKLPVQFTTSEIAKAAGIPRWLAQKMAYCLRQTGATSVVGKRGRSLLYQRKANDRAAA